MAKILVTGGAGYIGSVLVDSLVNKHEVVIVDNLSTGHDFLVNPGTQFEQADLRDLDTLTAVFQKHQPEIVMHLAAHSVVSESAEKAEFYRENNVQGTVNLIEAMQSTGCDQLVFSSTAAVYGEPMSMPITEEHPCQPINVYGETKLAAEQHILKSPIRAVILRYFNAAGASDDGRYGEFHEPETHLIPSILKAIQADQALKLFGDQYSTEDGTCVRDFIDVRDVANAHELAMNYLQNGGESEVFNLGSGRGYSVKEIIATCEKVLEKTVITEIHPPRSGDPEVLIASSNKAQQTLNWQPQKSLEEMIQSAWQSTSASPSC